MFSINHIVCTVWLGIASDSCTSGNEGNPSEIQVPRNLSRANLISRPFKGQQ